MKTITIEGNEYKVPDEAQWRAIDYDGDICCFTSEPIEDNDWFIWVGNGRREIGSSIRFTGNWRETKRRI